MYPGPVAKEFHKVKEVRHVFRYVGEEGGIVCISFTGEREAAGRISTTLVWRPTIGLGVPLRDTKSEEIEDRLKERLEVRGSVLWVREE